MITLVAWSHDPERVWTVHQREVLPTASLAEIAEARDAHTVSYRGMAITTVRGLAAASAIIERLAAGFVSSCGSCGADHSSSEWSALEYVGTDSTLDGTEREVRTCTCGAPLAEEVDVIRLAARLVLERAGRAVA